MTLSPQSLTNSPPFKELSSEVDCKFGKYVGVAGIRRR
jgi:hypothetical protein